MLSEIKVLEGVEGILSNSASDSNEIVGTLMEIATQGVVFSSVERAESIITAIAAIARITDDTRIRAAVFLAVERMIGDEEKVIRSKGDAGGADDQHRFDWRLLRVSARGPEPEIARAAHEVSERHTAPSSDDDNDRNKVNSIPLSVLMANILDPEDSDVDDSNAYTQNNGSVTAQVDGLSQEFGVESLAVALLERTSSVEPVRGARVSLGAREQLLADRNG